MQSEQAPSAKNAIGSAARGSGKADLKIAIAHAVSEQNQNAASARGSGSHMPKPESVHRRPTSDGDVSVFFGWRRSGHAIDTHEVFGTHSPPSSIMRRASA